MLNSRNTNSSGNRRDPLFRYERFFDTRRETILTMLTVLSDPTNAQRTLSCLSSLPVEIFKTPTTCLDGRELNSLCPNGRLNCLPAWSNVNLQLHGRTSTSQHYGRTQLLNILVGTQLLNTMAGTQLNLFQNLPNSQPISSGHDVIHTPAPFPVLGLLWQWWLSYPLRTSVNCTNWLHTWTLNPNSSKPNQTEW